MKDINKIKKFKRARRQARVRSKIIGSSEIPRLTVYRSLKHIYAQLVDDLNGRTLVSASDLQLKVKKVTKGVTLAKREAEKGQKKGARRKIDRAQEVGALLAQKATEKGISQVVFDRGAFKYHGRIKALAQAARQGGLKF